MRLQPVTIALGDRRWLVRPLTVAQVQAIEPLLAGAETGRGSIATAVAILRAALARDHADDSAKLDEIEAGAPEIAKAMADVLRLGGFLPSKGSVVQPGEAVAGPSPASTGPASMPG